MKEVIVGGEHCPIRGSLWTLIIYRDEFSRPGERKRADLIADVFGVMAEAAKAGIDLSDAENVDVSKVDMEAFFSILTPLLQVAWAMAKTAHVGGPFPGFEEWVKSHEDADLMALVGPVMEEAQRAFFRNSATALQAKAAAR